MVGGLESQFLDIDDIHTIWFGLCIFTVYTFPCPWFMEHLNTPIYKGPRTTKIITKNAIGLKFFSFGTEMV